MIIDPVCGMHIDPESAPAFYTYQEHTYYFCSDDCMQKFRANPEQYIDKARQLNPEGYGTDNISKAA
jgi:P-type Cu+ transporter